jgi:phage shock protein PspC (stress-responsive transcriptional regulator)
MNCPRCQKEIADGSNFCYFCGANMSAAAAPSAAPPSGEPRRLVRSVTDRKLGGVCAGLADYLGMDVSLVRVLAAVSVLFYGVGFVAYLVAWIIIPEGSPAGAAQSPPTRRLHRSVTDKRIGGVCGGVAEFLEADPSIIRIIWLVSVLVFGTGAMLYLLLWIILPSGEIRPAGMQPAS